MCGRFTLSTPGAVLARQLGLDEALPLALGPRYNIAPTQPVAVVRPVPDNAPGRRDQVDGARRLDLLRWGLIPAWAKDPAMGSRLINARSETVADKPAFRAAFRKRRCLIPADGFYEWATVGAHKQPYHFRLRDGGPFAFAGLWEAWHAPTGDVLETCTILTTDANDVIRSLHPRMPVILPPDAYARWLDPAVDQPGALVPLLTPYDPAAMIGYRVSPRVNSPANDDEACVVPVG
jgi:putative SOS response-associated peptidase YedK